MDSQGQARLRLAEPLRRSLRFLSYFAHPDRSFGGLYGHRNTRVYQPGGIAELSGEFVEAASLSGFMLEGIRKRTCVGLSSIDAPNLVPMFNSYCKAAAAADLITQQMAGQLPSVPCEDHRPFQRHFEEAGIIIDKRKEAYTIINWKKGGTVARYSSDGTDVCIDAGVLGNYTRSGRLVSTQGPGGAPRVVIEADRIEVHTQFTEVINRLPGPLDFLLLRIACVTVLRLGWVRELVKQLLVRHLMTRIRPVPVWNTREIRLGRRFAVKDAQTGKDTIKRMPAPRGFVSIHGATQGYWQVGDDSGDHSGHQAEVDSLGSGSTA